MGLLAGVAYFDGRPAERTGRALVARLRAITQDDLSFVVSPGMAVASSRMGIWTDERASAHPYCSPSGLVVAWDGRIDNRDDLLARLRPSLSDETSDAAIVSRAFERWGIEGLRRVIGEWAVAIWDETRRTLHLARDYMAIRPLYYRVEQDRILWSSVLGELVERAGARDSLSDEFMARFVTLQYSTDVTPYAGVRAVPAATCVSFSPAVRERRQQFWQITPATVRLRDRAEYEERLFALWREAVECRLRTTDIVWAELSGGLDSSSVVCMAHVLTANGRVPARAVQPLSHVTLRSPEGDERRFIAEVEAQISARSEIVGVEDHQEDADPNWDWVGPFAARGVALACAHRVRDRGGRLVLSGRLGDLVMGCDADNSVAVLDDLSDGHLLEALSQMRRWSRSTRKPFLEIARNILAARSRRHTGSTDAFLDPCRDVLSPRLRQLTEIGGLSSWTAPGDIPYRAGSGSVLSWIRPSKRPMASQLLRMATGGLLGMPEHAPGLIYTYPFAHRPLVEFMLAIPGRELSAPDDMRSLMRRAFEGLVPPRVLRRTSKGNYPPSALRAARPLVAAMLPVERLEVVQRGWADAQRLHGAVRDLVEGGGTSAMGVRRMLRLEQWLTSRNRRGPADIPRREEVKTNGVLSA
jgi:asparagine synthase (glutamine-hydrolysing)